MKKIITLISILFSFNISAQYTDLHDFDTIMTGSAPGWSSLVSDGTSFYGMTVGGGIKDSGVIYKININGTGYSKLHDFLGNNTDGAYPRGGLFYDGSFLYGVTERGGLANYGTLFKIKTDGSGYIKLLDFTWPNGANPRGTLVYDGTYLYGTAEGGGSNPFPNQWGIIYKIKPDGTGFNIVYNFQSNPDAQNPWGTLLYDGVYLYGMSETNLNGLGTNPRAGAIFKIKPDGSGYSKIYDFTGYPNSGMPAFNSGLVTDGTFLYGMTERGGINDSGLVFKIMPDGSGFTKVLDLTGIATGAHPHGDLIYDGTFLYGLTERGGTGKMGTLFRVKTDGSAFTKLIDFNNLSNGSFPDASPLLDNNCGYLYGTTLSGGHGGLGYGTIFKYSLLSSTYAIYPNATPHVWDVIPNYSPYTTTAKWTWGDGTYSMGLYPSHTYANGGWYNICVTSYSSCGDSSTYCHSDSVYRISSTASSNMTYINVLPQTTSINQNAISSQHGDIYPNPASDVFFIETNTTDQLSIDVYDLSGFHVLSTNVSDRSFIDVTSLNAGIYLVAIKTTDRLIKKKLVIVR